VTVPPATLPLTIVEAKRHLNLADDDATHDDIITQYIGAAVEQFETDTNFALMVRTVRVKLRDFATFYVPKTPLVSVTSVTYYDRSNALQTLASSRYSVDTAAGVVRFEDSNYPGVADRWDAVWIVYTIGKHAASTTVDALSKSAILLLVGHYFENRDMLLSDNVASMVAYERICKLRHRGTYP
jgi:uncharacterized phiE125 gp8 family phage protein